MPVWKGGRGAKAPYETTHIRVPLPLKQKIEQICEEYKQKVISGEDVTESEDTASIMEFEEALELAKTILKQKKSARVSLKSLLTGIYNRDIDL